MHTNYKPFPAEWGTLCAAHSPQTHHSKRSASELCVWSELDKSCMTFTHFTRLGKAGKCMSRTDAGWQKFQVHVVEFDINGARLMLQEEFSRNAASVWQFRRRCKVSGHNRASCVLDCPRRQHSCGESNAHADMKDTDSCNTFRSGQTGHLQHLLVVLP